ncbi:hypothetical protein OF83DRAFT_288014 [Amylostereum chailletii]|nr:hypothetical protein OF83DRAFT_288014 [Amylostereum chailletii]
MSRILPRSTSCLFRALSSSPRREKMKPPRSDAYALPLQPTWSVNGLLSSYPHPSIAPSTLNHLHRLSALVPPAEATGEHRTLIHELETLVKLVEAVKLVHVRDRVPSTTIPDGRVSADSARIDLYDNHKPLARENAMEQELLLAHAARAEQGLYVVDVERPHAK